MRTDWRRRWSLRSARLTPAGSQRPVPWLAHAIIVQKLCPFHACLRHRCRESPSQDCPLFPADEDLAVASQAQMVVAMRGVLAACGVDLFQTLEDGRQLHKYGGHCARASGAQWLHTMIQALGRWSFQAVLRYIQDAPLQVLPRIAATTLLQGAQSWAESSSVGRPASGADGAGDAVQEQPRKKGRRPQKARLQLRPTRGLILWWCSRARLIRSLQT